ncbi:DNA topoisomerase 3 [Chryseobacterium sp. Ch-15]|uniref:DNA topoisomerase n=1 Tax=Chryseobacterium muglaense TaxID=2893752 RepID=A0A9Q3YPR1_9FLAO|nr:type IA DNA topoisomerase [Chryseobacterium muglaense]MBD3906901.1 DNA topoisomerase 3 [Chryseobacterium muglaense]MCC9033054.1 DNA topoisomerase 3 [Chryseobacterium muglaense]MCM2556608.1 DNA topoisomerase 3 [Chryseobacterium muglaense]
MKAVIAEKPSVAREIALLLGATDKRDGFITGNGYCVTWALGHLISLAMPEDYGISGYQRASLPIFPDPFKLTVKKFKEGKAYVSDSRALKQLKIIEKVVNDCESIIVATDAGREGELIFRYIYEYLNCKKPFERLWISSLTEKAIKTGFENLKKGSDFDGLYHSAVGRSRADWLLGINASQALSIAAENGSYSLGRVQTPTLALLCERYIEHKGFTAQKYWQIQLTHQKGILNFKSTSQLKFDDQKKANEFLKVLERGDGIAKVDTVEVKNVTEQTPLLFDLTGLQKEANKKLNLSASETLDIAQSLYEKKFITYPRTGSKYIPEDMWQEIPNLIRVLKDRDSFKKAVSHVKWSQFNKKIVNDLGVTDHHGLLITEKIPSSLSAKENAIYDMIAYRLLEAISEACTKEVTQISLEVLHYVFISKGSRITNPGWRIMKGDFSDDENNELQELPHVLKGDDIKIKESTILERKTQPPSLFTEAGLLSAMENAGSKIEQEDQRKILRNIGIGTPATRAAIIEVLFKRDYIQKDKKSLVPTEKGLQVYGLIKDKKIADVTMTAEWELELLKIENNEIDLSNFQKKIEGYTSAITNELLLIKIVREDLPDLICPKCKKEKLRILDKIVKCKDDTCNWLQFRMVCGKLLTVNDIQLLVEKGKTSLIKGMKSKAGKSFDAYMILNDFGETVFEFDRNTATKKK